MFVSALRLGFLKRCLEPSVRKRITAEAPTICSEPNKRIPLFDEKFQFCYRSFPPFFQTILYMAVVVEIVDTSHPVLFCITFHCLFSTKRTAPGRLKASLDRDRSSTWPRNGSGEDHRSGRRSQRICSQLAVPKTWGLQLGVIKTVALKGLNKLGRLGQNSRNLSKKVEDLWRFKRCSKHLGMFRVPTFEVVLTGRSQPPRKRWTKRRVAPNFPRCSLYGWKSAQINRMVLFDQQ